MAEKQPISSNDIAAPEAMAEEQVSNQRMAPGYCGRIGAICCSGACKPACLQAQIEAAREALHREYAVPPNIREFLRREQ